jgi:hypothetical protein
MFRLGMADRQRTERGDAANRTFGLPVYLVDHKPGLDHQASKQEVERGDNHRFRRSDKKDIPRESLASRIGKPKRK